MSVDAGPKVDQCGVVGHASGIRSRSLRERKSALAALCRSAPMTEIAGLGTCGTGEQLRNRQAFNRLDHRETIGECCSGGMR